MKKPEKSILFLLLIVFLFIIWLGGCTPTRVNGHVPLAISTHFHHAPVAEETMNPTQLKSWWKQFQDPVLDDLISQAIIANQDIKIAKARVREAAAMVTISGSARYPSIGLASFGGQFKGIPVNQGGQLATPAADLIAGALVARWEIDIFGGRQLEAEASIAQARKIEASLNAVQVSLAAQLATDYLNLRGIQLQIGNLQENIQVQQERLRALRLFYRAGLASGLDISRQETVLHETEGILPRLISFEAAQIHRISVLAGNSPESLKDKLTASMPLPEVMPKIPNLLPASLLSQRPDLQFAQADVMAKAASLGAARTNLFPRVVLLATGGVGTIAMGGFPSLAESFYALGSGLTAPILDAGRVRAHIAGAEAQLDQSASHYEKVFLTALEDVENAFVSHQSALEHQAHRANSESAAEKSYQTSNALYQRGVSNYLSVLETQLARLAISNELIKAKMEVLVSMVSLYRAFGGGWGDMEMQNKESP